MQFKNPNLKKKNKLYPLEVSCAHCKTPAAIYLKGGNGGLIKMQLHRIQEAEVNIFKLEGAWHCHVCDAQLANLSDYRGKPTYWVIRGQINTKKLK
ncbi:hypothetical protein HZY86_05060 [Aerococcaceae bacterium DSM 111020]|nr:hypothetical protein [Aerococcaceae bacterium DSM 111020]